MSPGLGFFLLLLTLLLVTPTARSCLFSHWYCLVLSLTVRPPPQSLSSSVAWRIQLMSRADEAHQGRVTLDYNQFVSLAPRIKVCVNEANRQMDMVLESPS